MARLGSQAQSAVRRRVGGEPFAITGENRAAAGRALFRGLDRSARARVEALAEPVRTGAGEVLCAEGLPAEHAISVVSGVLKIFKTFKTLTRGRRQISRFLYADDFLCPMEHEANYGWTVQAVTATEVWRFERGPFFELVRVTPELERRLLEGVWTELEEAREHMLLLARKSAEQKVASFVLGLARAGGAAAGDSIHLAMTRRDIADHLGLQVETVSRTLRVLHRRGVIGLSAHNYAAMLRRRVLQSLAEGREGRMPT